MITIKEFYGDVKDIDESVLAVKSDCLFGKLLPDKNGQKKTSKSVLDLEA